MKVLFLTSSLGGYTKTVRGNETVTEIIKCDNSNGFINRLKNYSTTLTNFVCVASNPDGAEKTEMYANVIIQALNLDNFGIKNVSIIDHRFKGDIAETIKGADCLFLMGGSVPTQNAYFEEIGLKDILKNYNGIIIGQSAGSMNCNNVVYAQPEEDEEFEDKNFKRKIQGLGLVNFTIMPHMNSAEERDELNHPTVMEMCLEDSYEIPHYGIVDYGFIEVANNNASAYGRTLLIKNGECLELCSDKETIKIRDDYNYSKSEQV